MAELKLKKRKSNTNVNQPGSKKQKTQNFKNKQPNLSSTLFEDNVQEGKFKKGMIKDGTFEKMSLSQQLMGAIKRKGFQVPTPIQRRTIPLILQKFDVVAMARTGSGKTAAFVIPMLQRLQAGEGQGGAKALIINPTRELALQTLQSVNEMGRFLAFKSAVLVGGDSLEAQYEELATNPDILIVTPGRLLQHLQEVKGFNLQSIEYVVLDEADRLFEFGLMDQTNLILQKCSNDRQTMLFSATLPAQVAEFAQAGLRDPKVIRLDVDHKLPPTLNLAFFTVNQDQKMAALLFLLDKVIPPGQSSLVFASTKHMVELLNIILSEQGIACSHIYGDMDQTARVMNQQAFANRETKVLIVTDVAARGIDIPILDNVINFDFTSRPKNFVHRVGRAARAGRWGFAYSLLTNDELPYLLDLSLFLVRKFVAIDAQFLKNAQSENEMQENLEIGIQESNFDGVVRDQEDPFYYGKIPASVLDVELERVTTSLRDNEDAIKFLKSSQNADKLYKKTRPSPALESIRRCRTLSQETSHPLVQKSYFGNSKSIQAETHKQDLLSMLQNFRPGAKVFEDRIGRARNQSLMQDSRKQGAKQQNSSNNNNSSGQKSNSQLLQPSQLQNGMQDQFQQKDQEQNADLSKQKASRAMQQIQRTDNVNKFKDDRFFIPNQRQKDNFQEDGLQINEDQNQGFGKNSLQALRAATMELDADDSKGLAQQGKRFHWDSRQRRYVQLQQNEGIGKSGKRIKTNAQTGFSQKTSRNTKRKPLEPGQHYEKWQNRHKKNIDISNSSQGDQTKNLQMNKAIKSRFRKGGRMWKNIVYNKGTQGENKNAKDELASQSQIWKQRQKKQQKQNFMASRRQENKIQRKQQNKNRGKRK